jgi:hypothetical protein
MATSKVEAEIPPLPGQLVSMLPFFETGEIVVMLLVLLAVGWWLLCRPVRRRLRRQPLPVHVPLNFTIKVEITALVDGIKRCARFIAFFFVSVMRPLLRLFTTATLQLMAHFLDSLRQLYLILYVII